MAPGTLHTSPAAAQDPGQRRRGPQPGLCVSGGTQNSRAFSLHGVGRRHPSTPQIESAGCLRGKWGGRTIQVQRHGDGGSGWSRALAGEVRHLQRLTVVKRKGGGGPPLRVCTDPRPHTQARAFVLAPARLVFGPQLPSQSLSQTQRKPQPPNPRVPLENLPCSPWCCGLVPAWRPHSKRREGAHRTLPHSPQLREWSLSEQRLDALR